MLFGAGRFLCQVHFSAGLRPKYERLIKHCGQTNNGPIEDQDPGVDSGKKGKNTLPRKILCYKRFYDIVYATRNALVFDGLQKYKLFTLFFWEQAHTLNVKFRDGGLYEMRLTNITRLHKRYSNLKSIMVNYLLVFIAQDYLIMKYQKACTIIYYNYKNRKQFSNLSKHKIEKLLVMFH